jgi:predicted ferric reductase
MFIIALAVWLLFKYKSWKDYWILLAVLAAFFVFHGFVYMEQRYLFPCRVVYMFLAAVFLGYYIPKKMFKYESS